MKKIGKYAILEALLLIAMLLCGTGVMKIFDVIFKLNYESVWGIEFKVGFIAWIVMLVIMIVRLHTKNRDR